MNLNKKEIKKMEIEDVANELMNKIFIYEHGITPRYKVHRVVQINGCDPKNNFLKYKKILSLENEDEIFLSIDNDSIRLSDYKSLILLSESDLKKIKAKLL